MLTTKLTGQKSRCSSCGLLFTSTHAFDSHRTGSFMPNARRCRSETELRARGFEPNGRGLWRKPMAEANLTSRFITKETAHAPR